MSSLMINDEKYTRDADIMNRILEMLSPLDIESADRILAWVQMKIDLEWVNEE